MTTWRKEGVEVKTTYQLEFVQDQKTWEKICEDTHPAPWELYETAEYTEIGKAITVYLLHLFSPKTFDVKLFETITVNGEDVREAYIEPDSSLRWYIAEQVCKDRQDKIDRMEPLLRDAAAKLEQYEKFIRHCKAEKLFEKFTLANPPSDGE